ncbi:MAG: general secretion pathway protein GspK [Sedimentisphaerales bacterium]|nr:general secretion pathway protein GspK [Sedimentisphaerales bacterium]
MPARSRAGIVLLITLVLLVVLSALGYTLSARVAAQRQRDQYVIDYSQARYSCDSAVKYALATLEDLDPKLISRPNCPDFSDIYAMSEEDYQKLLEQLALEAGYLDDKEDKKSESYSDLLKSLEANDVGDSNNSDDNIDADPLDLVEIPGPYGPAWPFVTEPAEFELGTAKVKIEIEDENAKYPLGWALLGDPKIKREAEAGFLTFCEWMGMSQEDTTLFEEQLAAIGEIRPFQVDFKPITKTERTTTPTPAPSTNTKSSSSATTRTRRPLTRVRRTTISAAQQIAEQSALYARLFHSSLLDTERLARPLVVSEKRKESVLKYLGAWASMQVNINTAPRHVLETAFIFGGDADKIADEIIRLRRAKPFDSINELKEALYRYSDSINKCEKYITTTSNFFTIRVRAVSGGAEAASIIAITKDGKKVQRVAVVNI